MANRLETLLKPGEKVLCRARSSGHHPIFWLLAITALLGAYTCGLVFLSTWIRPDTELGDIAIFVLPPAALGFTLLAFHIRRDALVTNRRLLSRWGLLGRSIWQVPHSEVRRVHGLEAGSLRPVCVERTDGQLVYLGDLPQARRFGRAVAEAAGLPPPAPAAPLAERAAGVLRVASAGGAFLGALGALAGLGLLGVSADPGFVKILAFALAFTMVVPVPLGLLLGWLIGSLLGLVYLRPLLTYHEVMAAIHTDLDVPETPYRIRVFPWTRPIQERLARLFYGRATGAEEEPRGQRHGG